MVEIDSKTKTAQLERQLMILAGLHHDAMVTMQAAWIEWRHGLGSENAMQWIENTLWGPGLIPDESEPYGTEAQAYFDANRFEPWPRCFCGRPSNIANVSEGWCCPEHAEQCRVVCSDAFQDYLRGPVMPWSKIANKITAWLIHKF